ncbi:MAG: hypothetical protein ISS02_00885 [Candidatus Portnoybacteria bacterium]|nr:hypothetical protein [Candidatus Portnoybacteria bacterium]
MKKSFIIILLIFCSLFAIHFALAGYKLEVGLPSVSEGTKVGLVQYINYLYLFGLSLVGMAALISLVIGGFMYMLSDTVTTTDKAKEYISGAIYGLILALAAYLILNTINPDLVNWSIILPESSTPQTQTQTPQTQTQTPQTQTPQTQTQTPQTQTPTLPDTQDADEDFSG